MLPKHKEVVKLVKCLLPKHRHPSLNPQNLYKTWTWEDKSVNSLLGVEKVDVRGLLACLLDGLVEMLAFRFYERPPKNETEVTEKDIWKSVPGCPCAIMCCVHT